MLCCLGLSLLELCRGTRQTDRQTPPIISSHHPYRGRGHNTDKTVTYFCQWKQFIILYLWLLLSVVCLVSFLLLKYVSFCLCFYFVVLLILLCYGTTEKFCHCQLRCVTDVEGFRCHFNNCFMHYFVKFLQLYFIILITTEAHCTYHDVILCYRGSMMKQLRLCSVCTRVNSALENVSSLQTCSMTWVFAWFYSRNFMPFFV